jgi:hypothetical protein
MTPARYAVSADNNVALSKFVGAQVDVTSVSPPAQYDLNCRLMGPVQGPDGQSIPEFIHHAFNDEFKMARIYSTHGAQLTAHMTKIAFSSSSGLTNGWWDLSIQLVSSNGKTLETSSHTDFKSGFDGITACNQTAQALGGAVQDLIKSAIANPQFGALLRQ